MMTPESPALIDARRAAEHAARVSYGRLLAILAARSRDIAGAEDALAEAFASALRAWPQTGVPDNPDAWLLAAARNSLANAFRHRGVREAAAGELERRHEELAEPLPFRDERLKLMFVCAHPAIDPASRTPLMLQTVLGLDAARIGGLFLIAPAAMGQRLVRAKAKIKDAGLRFEVPETDRLSERLIDVLDAIYAGYGTGWDAVAGADEMAAGLAEEAIYLGRLVVELLPGQPEAMGLLALMLFCEARKPARLAEQGHFVPLAQQDYRLWRREMIIEAEEWLTRAARLGTFGRYQCEAAIQSVHVQRPFTGSTNTTALKTLYALLVRHYPSVGVRVGEAAVHLSAGEPKVALAALDLMEPNQVARYQPFWATRAQVLAALGDLEGARVALAAAVDLCTDEPVRTYLLEQGRRWD